MLIMRFFVRRLLTPVEWGTHVFARVMPMLMLTVFGATKRAMLMLTVFVMATKRAVSVLTMFLCALLLLMPKGAMSAKATLWLAASASTEMPSAPKGHEKWFALLKQQLAQFFLVARHFDAKSIFGFDDLDFV
jgi:uncharacterized paraquat-inducible protein A